MYELIIPENDFYFEIIHLHTFNFKISLYQKLSFIAAKSVGDSVIRRFYSRIIYLRSPAFIIRLILYYYNMLRPINK